MQTASGLRAPCGADIGIMMALGHFHVGTFSRSRGQRATAAAAYRSGELIHDRTRHQTYDYRRRRGIVTTALIYPDHVEASARHTRAELWNRVEERETRKNSTVAREFEMALPVELEHVPGAYQRLMLDIAGYIAQRYGIVIDAALHAPRRLKPAERAERNDGREDNGNWHLHLLTPTRTITATGTLDAKVRKLDDRRLGAEEIRNLRDEWTRLVNTALEQASSPERMNLRSYAEQGLDIVPTVHLGPAVAAMERRGIQTERGDINRAIQKRRQQLHEIEAELEMLKQAEAEDFERQRQAEETQKHTASRRPPATAEAKPAPQKKTSWLGLVGSLVPKRRKPNKAPEPAQQPPDQQAPPPPSPSASRRSPAPSRPFLFTTPERTEPQPQEQPPAIGLFASSPGELSEPSRAEVNEPAQQPTELSVQSQQAPHAPAQQSDLLHQLYNNEEWCKEIERILKKGEISNEDELKKLEYVFEDISHAIDYPDSYSDNEFDKKELEKTQKKIYSMMQQYKGQITTEYQEYQREEQSQANTNLYGLNIEVYGLKTDAEQEQQRSQKGRDKQ